MSDFNQIEQEIFRIKERNWRVEIDKKWETSWFRRLLIIIFTYFVERGAKWKISILHFLRAKTKQRV